jgi:hypothetical protein
MHSVISRKTRDGSTNDPENLAARKKGNHEDGMTEFLNTHCGSGREWAVQSLVHEETMNAISSWGEHQVLPYRRVPSV